MTTVRAWMLSKYSSFVKGLGEREVEQRRRIGMFCRQEKCALAVHLLALGNMTEAIKRAIFH